MGSRSEFRHHRGLPHRRVGQSEALANIRGVERFEPRQWEAEQFDPAIKVDVRIDKLRTSHASLRRKLRVARSSQHQTQRLSNPQSGS